MESVEGEYLAGFITATKPKTNQHGLSRYIEASLKLEIRKNSGFGCVVCGAGIVDYEHIDPEFKDATEHNPNGITLLCVNCHAKKTRKFWSPGVIKEAMKNPKCLQDGYVKEQDLFYIGKGYPTIVFAGSKFNNTPYPLVVGGIPIIAINSPETDEDRFTISAVFYDSNEKPSLHIERNEWLIGTDNWDVTTEGGTLIVRQKKGEIHLLMKSKENKIIIEKIYSKIRGYIIDGNKDQLVLTNIATGGKHIFRNCIASYCMIGINL